jgi:hypothetical protein
MWLFRSSRFEKENELEQMQFFEIVVSMLAIIGGSFAVDVALAKTGAFDVLTMENIFKDMADAVPLGLEVRVDSNQGTLELNKPTPYVVDLPFVSKWTDALVHPANRDFRIRFQMHFVTDESEVPPQKQTWLNNEVALLVFSPYRFRVLHMLIDPFSDAR